MKAVLGAVVICLMGVQASAWEGEPIACYEKVRMSAKLKVWKTLVKPAKQQYEERNGQMQLVHYPAVYKEHRQVLEPEYILLRERPCKG